MPTTERVFQIFKELNQIPRHEMMNEWLREEYGSQIRFKMYWDGAHGW